MAGGKVRKEIDTKLQEMYDNYMVDDHVEFTARWCRKLASAVDALEDRVSALEKIHLITPKNFDPTGKEKEIVKSQKKQKTGITNGRSRV